MILDEVVEVSRLIGSYPEFWGLLKVDLCAWRGQENKREQQRNRFVKWPLLSAHELLSTWLILPWERLSWEWHAMPKL